MSIDLNELGFKKEEILQRVVDQVSKAVLNDVGYDFETGDYCDFNSEFKKKIVKKIEDYVDLKFNNLAEKHVIPKISEFIDNLKLMETNKWGQKKGEEKTFVEYIVLKVENYFTQKVNKKGEPSNYDHDQPRFIAMFNELFDRKITFAIEQSMESINGYIKGGITEAIRIKLEEILDRSKIK